MRDRSIIAATMACIVVLTPAIDAVVRELAAYPVHEQPRGDRALLEVEVRRAQRGEARLGAYSRFGWRHPGPLSLYLAVPAYTLGDQRTTALRLWTVVPNAFLFAIMIWAAWSATTRPRGAMAAVVGIAIATAVLVLGYPHSLYSDYWNPAVALVPLFAAILLSAVILCGRPGWLPVLVFCHAACVQAHVACVLPATTALAVGTWAAARHLTRHGRQRTMNIASLSMIVAVACWALPVMEAATNDGGNLARCLEWLRSGPHQRVPGRWLEAAVGASAPIRHLVALVGADPEAVSDQGWALLGLVNMLGPTGLALRLRSHAGPLGRALLLATAAQLVVAPLSVYLVTGSPHPYLFLWLLPVTGAAWMSLCLALLGYMPAGRAHISMGVSFVIAIVLQLGPSRVHGPSAPQQPGVDTLACLAAHSAPDSVRLLVYGRHGWRIASAVALRLDEAGQHLTLAPEEANQFGEAFAYAPIGAPVLPRVVTSEKRFRRLSRIGEVKAGGISVDYEIPLDSRASCALIGDGWASGSPEDGTEMLGSRADLRVGLWPRLTHDLTIEVRARSDGPLTVELDGRSLGRASVGDDWREVRLVIPPKQRAAHTLTLVAPPHVRPRVRFVRASPRIPDACR